MPLVLGLLLVSGCSSPEPEGSPSPSAEQSTEVYTGSEPSGSATPEPEESDSPSVEPSPEPTSPIGDAGEGATAAPELPVQEASADEPVEFETGIDVSLGELRATTVEAQTPGEVSGPAVVVEVLVENTSTDPIDLGSAVVTLEAGDDYGIGTTAGSPQPFAGELAAGESARASYVFMIDPATDREVSVSVNYAAGEPVAVFTGRTS